MGLVLLMKDSLEFFCQVSSLKTMQRTGWVWAGLKNPETIAEHSFRTAFFAWILGKKAGLNVGRMIPMAIVHDICEVYAGDLTPYFGILPKDSKKRRELTMRWVRLPQKKKISISQKKLVVEENSLKKLIAPLSQRTQRDIFSLWEEFEHGRSAEGRFVRQVDRLEAMLQAIEYFGTGPNTPVAGFWEGTEEIIEHPLLLNFAKALEDKFYKNKKTEFDGSIDFLMNVGKLKRMPRRIWTLRGVENPDSVANQLFMLTLMTWVLAKQDGGSLNMEKLMYMTLSSRICALYNKERTPYDDALKKITSKEEREILMSKVMRQSFKEKQRVFRKGYKDDRAAVVRIIQPLDSNIKDELLSVWDEGRKNETKEARFFGQMHALESLLQALRYHEAGQFAGIKAWWEWAFERSDSKVSTEFMDECKKRFIKKK